MKILLLLAAAMALAQGSSSTLPPARECSGADPQDGHSMLSSLLQVTGYSDTCVAGCLDYCSSAMESGDFTALIEEARGIVQQVNIAVNNMENTTTHMKSTLNGTTIDNIGTLFRNMETALESRFNITDSKINNLESAIKKLLPPPRHCQHLHDSGDRESGLRTVYPYDKRRNYQVTVYCDQSTDGGGWTVFQRRTNNTPREDFERTWREYELGFGDLEGEFWLGLHHLHALTSTSPQELRIDLAEYEGGKRWAKYGQFKVDGASTDYRLTIGRYSGNAGGDSLAYHNGAKFSTHDADHDTWGRNCAQEYRGAWWYKSCHDSNLNGYQYEGASSPNAKGIVWEHWRGNTYSLKGTSMMIRPGH